MAHLQRPLQPDDVDNAARLLAQAFADTPTFAAVLSAKGPARKLSKLESLERGFIKACLLRGGAWGVETDGQLAGVALAYPPGVWPLGLREQAHHARGGLRLSLREMFALAPLAKLMLRHHLTDPHWYLAVLGTRPDVQGQGIGKQMMQHLVDAADRDGVPSYLETDDEQNVGYYQRFGFDVVARETVTLRAAPTAAEVVFTFMSRPPSSTPGRAGIAPGE